VLIMNILSSSLGLVYLTWLLVLTPLAESTDSRPVQFCKQDDALKLDFCVAVVPYRNTTSSSTDLYVTITRTHSSSHGWLGIGLGSVMDGALMFILYQDPQNPDVLKTSVRTATGHHRPIEISASDSVQGQSLPDIRVLKSAYEDGTSDRAEKPTTGTANVLIYSAHLWPKTSINPTSASQPWIWAHNPASKISSPDETFEMHGRHTDSGFGFFWTDFSSALSTTRKTPPFPAPDKSSGLHLAITTPPPIHRLGGPSVRNWMFHLHGALASLAFLALYPLGALLLRTSDPRAFNFHWTTQALASVLLCLGAGLGWVLSRRIELVHQVVGLVIVGLMGMQVLLGWRHHIKYLRTKAGTWMGKSHVWIGRALLAMGWVNVLLGLKARGYGWLTLLAAGLVVLAEAALLVRVLGFRKKGLAPWFRKNDQQKSRRAAKGRAGAGGNAAAAGLGEEYFELVGEDDEEGLEDEDVDYDEDGRLKADVEWEERLKRGGAEGGPGEDGNGEGEQAKKLQKLDVV
jgi:Cytochrome domain of cellobiose dehydrogenase